MKNIINLYPVIFKTALLALLISTQSCSNSSQTKNTGAMDATTTDSAYSANEKQFFVKVANINLEEIQLGQLAQQNGSLPAVRDMGKMMEEDHRKCMNELTVLANKKSITLPAAVNEDAQADYKKLSEKSGSAFDKDYCDMMVSGHKDAISLFKDDSATSTDQGVKQWVISTLPALRKHLSHAIACQDQCK